MSLERAAAPRGEPGAGPAPVASVVIPAWNAAATLAETIASVQAQTLREVEVIVVDDGSTDETPAIVRAFAGRDPRVSLVRRANGGIAAARNSGIARARAERISFLDADDLWTPDLLESHRAMLDARPAAGFVYSFSSPIDAQGRPLGGGARRRVEGRVVAELFACSFVDNGSCLTARRSAIAEVGGFDESLEGSQDFDLAMRLAERWEVACVPRPQVLYRQSETSHTGRVPDHVERALLTILDRTVRRSGGALAPLRQFAAATFRIWLATRALGDVGGPEGRRAAARLLSAALAEARDPMLRLRIRAAQLHMRLLAALPASVTGARRGPLRRIATPLRIGRWIRPAPERIMADVRAALEARERDAHPTLGSG